MPARKRMRILNALALCLALNACQAISSVGDTFFGGGVAGPGSSPRRIGGFIGGVTADEPNAAVAGREVLALGGNAADAAVAIGFTLAVTYPSRASLGGGGACLAYSPGKTSAGGGVPEAILFLPVAPAAVGAQTDRPAAVPTLARGLFALHARYGRRPFETLVSPAEQLARFGVAASRSLVRDLQAVSGPLLADPGARAVFAPGGSLLTEGTQLVQADLGATLAQLRIEGVGDLYQGGLAQRFQNAAQIAGGGVSLNDLRGALPKTVAPIIVTSLRDRVAFLPPPADGGLAAAAAYRVLLADPSDLNGANARAIAVAARWRSGGVDAEQAMATTTTGGSLQPLPASTTFATLDRDGNAVVCAVTMNNLFGTGRIAPGTGIVMAASPGSVPQPLLAAAIAWNPNLRAFHAEVGGSGQEGAPLAVAAGMSNALRSSTAIPVPVPDPGRENAILCSRYLPDSDGSCTWATDSRGSGLAAGSN